MGAPRGGGRTTDHAADLRRASEASAGLKKYLPASQAVLLGYPKATAAQMRESFFWVKSSIEGKATYILTHLMATPDGAAYALARRQYYASTSYNGEQSVAGFLPLFGRNRRRVSQPRLHGPGRRLRRLHEAQHRQQCHGAQDERDFRSGPEESRLVSRVGSAYGRLPNRRT